MSAVDLPETDVSRQTAIKPAELTSQSPVSTARVSAEGFLSVVFALVFWGGICAIFLRWKYPSAWDYLYARWWLVAAPTALLMVLAAVPSIRRASATTRTGLTVFLLIPVVLSAIAWATLQQDREPTRLLMLRYIFCTIACLFPAVIYYLFIATRKIGLLNDYFANMRRLGLLEPRSSLPLGRREQEYRVRLINYIQEFETLYGPLPEALITMLIAAEDPLAALADHAKNRPSTWGIAQVFTADVAVPIVAATALMEIGWMLILFVPAAGTGDGGAVDLFYAGQLPTTYAFLGAYFFALQFLFRRFVRGDLRKSAYVAVSMRILLAIVGTSAVIVASRILFHTPTNEIGGASGQFGVCLVAFVIGVFPRVAWQFIQGAWKALMSKFGRAEILPSLYTELPVSDLDGLTVWHQARLEEEDVENVPNMASCDMLGIMVSTKIASERIVDWVDQAILYTHLGPERTAGVDRRAKLRAYGILTATSLLVALQNARQRSATEIEMKLTEAAGADIRVLVDSMRTNSNLELVCAWRGITLSGERAEPPREKPEARVVELKTAQLLAVKQAVATS